MTTPPSLRPPALMGLDPAAVQLAAADFLDDVLDMVRQGEMNANNLFNRVLIDDHAQNRGLPQDVRRARDVVHAYAWWALGATCAAAAPSLPDDVELSPEFLTDSRPSQYWEALVMTAAAGLRAPIPTEPAHSMYVRYANPDDQPVPPGMIEHSDIHGRRAFFPDAIADPPPRYAPNDVMGVTLDRICVGLEQAGFPTTNQSPRVRAARAEREAADPLGDVAGIIRDAAVSFAPDPEPAAVFVDEHGDAAAVFVDELAAGLEFAGIQTANGSHEALRARAEFQRDEAYVLFGLALGALAAVYPSAVVSGHRSDIHGCPVLYIDTPAGQISHHYSAADAEKILCHVPSTQASADQMWDGHTSEVRAMRLLALCDPEPPDLLRDLLDQGMSLTIGRRAGEPHSNNPDCPEPGTPDYYEAEVFAADGSHLVARGDSEVSPLQALMSLKLTKPDEESTESIIATARGGGWGFSQEPPF